MSKLPVGFIGLGAMGGGMAKVLLKEGFIVTGYDISQPLVDRFVEAGGKSSNNPVKLAEQTEVLVLMVVDSSQVNSVLFDEDTGAIKSLRQNAAIVICLTVPPHFCDEVRERLDSEFNRPDVFLLDCPVSGGTTRAASGELSVFSAGPEAGLTKAWPVLEAIGGVLYKIPGGIGFGSKAKMCHQVLPEVEIALANEAMALAALAGLNTREVYNTVQSSRGLSWINGNRIPYMLDGDLSVHSAVPNSQKDSSIIVNQARLMSFPVPLVAAAEQFYIACIHAGWAKDDDSTSWRLYLPRYPEDTIHQMTKETQTLVPRNGAITIQDIIDIFVGVHLATSAEAMGFTEAVGMDTGVMYDIISKAAGSNWQFVEHVPRMKKPTWSLRDVPAAEAVSLRLERALSKANGIGAALPIAAASLQVFKLQLR